MYSFFIIIDTNDPNSFWVEMTKMNYRLRFSALKSNHSPQSLYPNLVPPCFITSVGWHPTVRTR